MSIHLALPHLFYFGPLPEPQDPFAATLESEAADESIREIEEYGLAAAVRVLYQGGITPPKSANKRPK